MSVQEDSAACGTFPDWVRSAVFYQIFPDRFRRSVHYAAPGHFAPWGCAPTASNFCGGNLRGIEEGLDHIQELGCNALYLCPIFASTANHRYHTHDYWRIDPILGDDADFDRLVREVHRRGMRIILDGVFNHCSRGLYQFNSILETGEESPYRDWFYIRSYPVNAYGPGDPNYACWWGIRELPKFNTDNPEVRTFLWSVAEFWTRRGIDGWRLDVPNEIDDDEFWREFRRRVKAINPETYIVGEIWNDPERWLRGDQFDGVMHYPLRRLVLEELFPQALSRPEFLSTGEPPVAMRANRTESAADFCRRLRECFPENRFGIPLNLLGSHDTVRLTTLAGGETAALSLAWAILMMLPGAPCVYYGDELGLEGGRDPDNRRCFPWDRVPSARQHGRVWKELREWIRLRATSDVLRRGTLSCEARGPLLIITREFAGKKLELHAALRGAAEGLERYQWRLVS